MNPARIVYEDAPAFIPVPAELQHCRVEAIFWPLENDAGLDTETQTTAPDSMLPPLGGFRETLPKQSVSASEFCRVMRDEDRY